MLSQGAATAILYSESADIFLDTIDTYGSGLRSLYLALRHAELPIDIVIEEDLKPSGGGGLLQHYSALYLTQPHLTTSGGAAVASWVSGGGKVFATASAGLLNESNQTNLPMVSLLGIEQSGVYTSSAATELMGGVSNASVFYIKQDLKHVEELDQVILTTVTNDPLASNLTVKGAKSIFKIIGDDKTGLEILGRFASDGSVASFKRSIGSRGGAAYYMAFLPGLSYYEPAIPVRPVDRSSVDSGFNHFIPTEMDTRARELIASPLRGVRCCTSTTVYGGMHTTHTTFLFLPAVGFFALPVLSLIAACRRVAGRGAGDRGGASELIEPTGGGWRHPSSRPRQCIPAHQLGWRVSAGQTAHAVRTRTRERVACSIRAIRFD